MTPLKSFFIGGFECATHIRRDRTRIDVTQATRHDTLCEQDYAQLAEAGIHTIRDGLRWHLIEATPGIYDWSSFLPMLHAAHRTGSQVLWDICHWGVPPHIDIFSPEFPTHFATFAAAAAALIHAENLAAGLTTPQVYCPVNEISFWAWVGGDEQHFHPFEEARGPELKTQLVRASLAAITAIRAADPTALILQPEPLIHISADAADPEDVIAAATHTASQFEAWDMLLGQRNPELNGTPTAIDIIGVNFYWNNGWVHMGERTPPGHYLHKPLHIQLLELWQRYRLPIVIAETGAEHDAAPGWLGYIAAEVRQAIRLGVTVLGVCLYPVMDYPGWDDDRHCLCGLLQTPADWSTRTLRPDLLAELRTQQSILPSP